jgi:AraC-like DNA-binding protein
MTYRLNILYADYEEHVFDRGWEGRPYPGHGHSHRDIYHMVLYVSGKNSMIFDGRRCECQRGSLALVSPGETHSFTPLQKGGISYVEAAFTFLASNGASLTEPFHKILSYLSGAPAEPLNTPLTLDEPMTVFTSGKIGELTNRLLSGGADAPAAAGKAVSDIFHALSQRFIQTAAPPGDSLTAVKEEIERRYSERLTLGRLAAGAKLSREYLCRRFRSLYSLSPLAYQRKLRVMAAGNLLKTSSMSCKEIAAATGFSDEHSFSRQFKEDTGLTPSAFRRGANMP